MANNHTTQLIQFYKRAILNYFQTASIYFMTNQPSTYVDKAIGERKINGNIDLVRKNNLHAHMRVQQYTKSGEFKVYDYAKYYYVTSSIFEVKNVLSLNLREDLVRSWAEGNYKSGQILLIDENKQEMYDIPVEDIISLHCKEKSVKNISVNFNHDVLLGFNLDLLKEYKVKFDNSSEPVEKYLDEHWEPKYIGNTSYSQHRVNTFCACRIYDRDGNMVILPDYVRTAKSLKMLYDTIASVYSNKIKLDNGKFAIPNVSYKTFQRHAASNKPIILDSGTVILVSKDLSFNFPERYDEHIYNDELLGKVNYTTEELEVKDINKEEVTEVISSVDGEIETDEIEIERTPAEIIGQIKNATEDDEIALRRLMMLQFGFPPELLE